MNSNTETELQDVNLRAFLQEMENIGAIKKIFDKSLVECWEEKENIKINNNDKTNDKIQNDQEKEKKSSEIKHVELFCHYFLW